MEISRWWSEARATPPDRVRHIDAPRREREECTADFCHPCRGGCFFQPLIRWCRSLCSLNHRLISFHPPGEKTGLE